MVRFKHILSVATVLVLSAVISFAMWRHAGESLVSYDGEDYSKDIALSAPAMIQYAQKWAYSRNPQFYHYTLDCANFTSQILYAGGLPMIKVPGKAWYHYSRYEICGLGSITGIEHRCRRWYVSRSWTFVDDFREWIVKRVKMADATYIGVPMDRWHTPVVFEDYLNEYVKNGVAILQVDLNGVRGPDHNVFLYKKDGHWYIAAHSPDMNDTISRLWTPFIFAKKVWLIRIYNVLHPEEYNANRRRYIWQEIFMKRIFPRVPLISIGLFPH